MKGVNTVLSVTSIGIQLCILNPWHAKISKDLQDIKRENVLLHQQLVMQKSSTEYDKWLLAIVKKNAKEC